MESGAKFTCPVTSYRKEILPAREFTLEVSGPLNRGMRNSEIRRENARLLARQADPRTPIKAFADRLDKSSSLISQYIGKNPSKNIGDEVAQEIETAFNKPRGWLDAIHPETRKPLTAEDDRPAGTNTQQAPDHIAPVPLFSSVTAGKFCETNNFTPQDAERIIHCPVRHGPRAYALVVDGDSMTSTNPYERSYPHGTIIYVDPDKPHINGSKVIALIPGTGQTTFKKYVEDAGRVFLMPLNPSYPRLDITQETHICAVLIAALFEE